MVNKNVDAMFRFFNAPGRERVLRRRVFEVFSPAEIFQMLSLLQGRDAHDIVAFCNTCKVTSSKITEQDVKIVRDMFLVKDVQES